MEKVYIAISWIAVSLSILIAIMAYDRAMGGQSLIEVCNKKWNGCVNVLQGVR